MNTTTIKSTNLVNTMVINPNPINKINTTVNLVNNNRANPNLLTNQVFINKITPNIPTTNIINNRILPSQPIVNQINPSLVNLNGIANINQLGKGINNKTNLTPGIQLVSAPNLTNNNILSINNLREPSETINLAEFKVVKEIGAII